MDSRELRLLFSGKSTALAGRMTGAWARGVRAASLGCNGHEKILERGVSGWSIAAPSARISASCKKGQGHNAASVKSEKPQELARLGLEFGGRSGTRTCDISIMNAAL